MEHPPVEYEHMHFIHYFSDLPLDQSDQRGGVCDESFTNYGYYQFVLYCTNCMCGCGHGLIKKRKRKDFWNRTIEHASVACKHSLEPVPELWD